MKTPTLWMVRAGEGGVVIDDFLSKNMVAIGWKKVGDLTKTTDLDEMKSMLRSAYPDASANKVNNNAGQIYRFRAEFQKGDYVITYNPSERTYHLGEIISDYKYLRGSERFSQVRDVKWIKEVHRDTLSTRTKNSLGSTMTIFKIRDHAVSELLGISAQHIETEDAESSEDETLDTLRDDIEARAHEFIKDKVDKLDWDELQELVAGILRGMGYRTIVSPAGPDRGKDIVASPDGLGLENPKIKVEVKHRAGSMGAAQIRNFIGGLRPGDRGLYVSTGGYSREAQYEAERANIPITLIDSDMLVKLIIQHYDHFDPDTRALMPLKKIYWPV